MVEVYTEGKKATTVNLKQIFRHEWRGAHFRNIKLFSCLHARFFIRSSCCDGWDAELYAHSITSWGCRLINMHLSRGLVVGVCWLISRDVGKLLASYWTSSSRLTTSDGLLPNLIRHHPFIWFLCSFLFSKITYSCFSRKTVCEKFTSVQESF